MELLCLKQTTNELEKNKRCLVKMMLHIVQDCVARELPSRCVATTLLLRSGLQPRSMAALSSPNTFLVPFLLVWQFPQQFNLASNRNQLAQKLGNRFQVKTAINVTLCGIFTQSDNILKVGSSGDQVAFLLWKVPALPCAHLIFWHSISSNKDSLKLRCGDFMSKKDSLQASKLLAFLSFWRRS